MPLFQKLEDQPSIEYKCMHSSYEGMRDKNSNKDRLKAWEEGKRVFHLLMLVCVI